MRLLVSGFGVWGWGLGLGEGGESAAWGHAAYKAGRDWFFDMGKRVEVVQSPMSNVQSWARMAERRRLKWCGAVHGPQSSVVGRGSRVEAR